MDLVDQAMLSLLDGVDHGAATVVTLGTTMAARKLWNRVRRRAGHAGGALGEKERALLAAEPGQAVDVGSLRRLLEAIPRHDLAGPAARGDSFSIGGDYIAGDYVAGYKEHIEGVKNVNVFGAGGSAAAGGPAAGVWPRAGQAGRRSPTARWDVGVITVLSEETSAVTAMLNAAGHCSRRAGPGGLRFAEAEIETAGQNVTVVVTQALDRGQRPAALAFGHLREHYAPATVVLAGIAGGISPAVRLGDVIVVQEVIYYDMRKERPGQVVHRGQARPIPAVTRRAVNAFFSDYGEPYRATIQGPGGKARTCHVLPGPIGSGEAVIAFKDSEIRRYLTGFNDKTLALETEAGGLAEAFYETAGTAASGTGWLAIRGISDHADAEKDDSCHEIASWHAAAVLGELLPYLKAEDGMPC